MKLIIEIQVGEPGQINTKEDAFELIRSALVNFKAGTPNFLLKNTHKYIDTRNEQGELVLLEAGDAEVNEEDHHKANFRMLLIEGDVDPTLYTMQGGNMTQQYDEITLDIVQ